MTLRPPDQQFHASRAAGYDKRIGEAIPGYHTLHRLSCALVAEACRDLADGRVLVVGAGTGTECLALAEACPGLRVAGVDPAAEMVSVGEAKVAASGLGHRVSLIRGEVGALPTDSVFDAATLLLVMHFLPDDGAKARLLAQIAVRCKPGAPLLVADLFRGGAASWRAELTAAWRRLQLLNGIPAEEADKGFKVVARDIHPISEARLRVLLREAGFGPPRPFFRALGFGGWMARLRGRRSAAAPAE